MNTPGDFNKQLSDLAVILCGKVAERLAYISKDLEPSKRKQIAEMLENNLPTVISNTIAKTASLHSTKGVQYLEDHLDDWADAWAKKFIGSD